MARSLQIVFSRPPEGVSDEEFDRWYDAHLGEILAVPGFVSAQRFRIEPGVADPEAAAPYRYLAVYEVEGDFDTLMKELAKANLGTKDSYAELKKADSGGPPLPAWWDEVRFASWNCIPVGERVTSR